MNGKKERLLRAYDFLKYEGVVRTQVDVANAMHAAPTNISSAFKGKEGVLTDKFLVRFCRAFKQISLDWLLYEEGPMLTITPEFKSENIPQALEGDADKDVVEEQAKMTARIIELINESGEIPKTFALKANIEVSLFLQKLKGQKVWSVADMHKICDTFKVRKGWLVDGDGQKFRVPDEVLETIPALPSKYTQSQIDEILENINESKSDEPLLNAADLFTDQALRVEKFIVMLSDEISEVRTIKQELEQVKEENANLRELLRDAISALRSASKAEQRTLMAADGDNI